MCPAEGRGGNLRKAEVADLARLHLLRHRGDRLLDRDGLVRPVEVPKVDFVDAEAVEGLLEGCSGVLGVTADELPSGRAGLHMPNLVARKMSFLLPVFLNLMKGLSGGACSHRCS